MTITVIGPADRLDTLPPFPLDGSVLTLAPAVAHWAEGILVQPNGPRSGQLFRFTPRQFRFLCWWYGIDEDGRWLYDHGARRLAKGSGKSPFAAVLGLCEFCGPCRVRDIDHKRRLVIGKSVDMPLVQIAATAESQTGNTMRMVRAFAHKGSPIVDKYRLDPGKTRYYRLPEGTLEIITSSPTAAEGAEPSFNIADETEHWRPNNSGDELAATLADNLAKSGSRMLETNNAWIPGQASVAEATFAAWLAQEEGRVVDAAGRILYDAVISRPDLDWSDPAAVRADMERIYADCAWQAIDGVMGRIFSPRSKLSDSRRKYGNRPTVAEDAWVEPEQWETIADRTQVVADQEYIAMFFDGSKSRDATALVGCRMSDGHVFLIDMWEPSNRHDVTDPVPAAAVDLAVRRAKERYRVVGFFGDVREWESFVHIDWPALFGTDELLVMAVPGGKSPQWIAWDMRTHNYEFTKGCELTAAEIEDRKFTHDGDPRLARHVGNARRDPNRYGVSIRKESPDSPLKGDGAVCVVGVRIVRQLVLATKAWKRRSRRTGRAVF